MADENKVVSILGRGSDDGGAGGDTSEAKLRDTITMMDCHSQMAFDRIQGICAVTRKAIAQIIDEMPVSPSRAFMFDVSKALEAMQYLASDTEDVINCSAEEVDCNYKKPQS